ncbi:TPA: hypothetical protein HA225_01855 [Candidatus Micrarchaeota archaeon]|nr:hypothetical protein [Candidatus Micrarchaeota archaeon]
MELKALIFVLGLISLLAFGCAAAQGLGGNSQGPSVYGQPAPPGSPNATTAQVERTGTGANPGVGAQPGETSEKSQSSCSLALSPQSIYAGDSTEVGFSVYSSQNSIFTFNCGEEIREISTGGLISGSRMCQFNSPGEQTVWIKEGERVCAEAKLVVKDKQLAPKNCYINESTVKRDLGNYYYETRVHFSGFSPDDELKWVCDYTVTRKKLGGDSVMGMPLYSDIYCDFSKSPYKDSIIVSIGEITCGSISTR